MKHFIAAAVVLAAIAGPALADSAAQQPAAEQQGIEQSAALDHDKVMGQEVFSSDGQSIGNVVDALVAPNGTLVAVAVVDPKSPQVGIALPAELLAVQQGKLTADITTAEIAALPEPEQEEQTPEPEIIPDGEKPVEQ